MSKYDPNSVNDDDLISALKEEEKFTTSNRDRHDVKLEKEGEIWQIRFLPVRFGQRKLFFSRIAQHWINKRPYFCAKVTPAESGGEENSQCDLCDVSAELSEHRIKDVATLGYKSGANPQWLTYCLVWSKKAPGQDMWEPQGDEVWTPYKFWLNKTLFEEVREYYLRYKEKRPTLVDSILNPDHGFDFYVKRSNNKLVLQKDDPRSIFPDGFSDAEKLDLMNHIMGQIKMPNYRALSTEEMEAARIKLEDAAHKLELGGSSTSRRGKPQSDSDNTDLPQQRPAASRFGARSPARQVEAAESEPARPAPRPAPAPPRSVPSARPAPRSVPPARPAPVQADSDGDDIPFDHDDSGAPEDSPAPAQAPTPSSRLRQVSRQSPPPARSEPPARSSTTSSVDDDDDVTDETHDPAPADGALPEDDAPPAPVTRVQTQTQTPAPARPTSRMSERLRGAIQRTQQ
jgi:hypothetical protein